MNDFNCLIDITDQIIPEEDPKFFNEEEGLEVYEMCIQIMDELIKTNPKIISEPEFEEIFEENIHSLMHSHFDYDIFYTEEAEEEMEELIDLAKKDFFKFYIPPRSYSDSIILDKELNIDFITRQLHILRNKPQPEQRTKEWYEFRHNLITASNAYKAFENQTIKNQLIYEKCQPLNPTLYSNSNLESALEDALKTVSVTMVNTNSTLHWGQKYEPLSVKIYEFLYETKIEDFGCIQHDDYKFIGASPDGINVDKQSKRYGRMLEIKNIVNREIDGIPKKEYWIQMQMQMEVCNLDECDFLETKFTEYVDRHSFNDDANELDHEDENGIEFTNLCLAKDGKMKGIIIYFHTKEGKPFYVYKPLDYIHPQDILEWEEKMLELYQSPSYYYTYMKFIYWKAEQISCVLVPRHKQWFQDNIQELQDLWTDVEHDRINGYEHRAPNRRQKKDNAFEIMTSSQGSGFGCLLQFDKTSGKITVVKKDPIDET
jgi:putative phage-type endonuclease